MPLIYEEHAAYMRAPNSQWPYVKSPHFAITDFPWQSGVMAMVTSDEVVVDYDLEAVYPAPVRVPHNQDLNVNGYSAAMQWSLSAAGTTLSCAGADGPWRGYGRGELQTIDGEADWRNNGRNAPTLYWSPTSRHVRTTFHRASPLLRNIEWWCENMHLWGPGGSGDENGHYDVSEKSSADKFDKCGFSPITTGAAYLFELEWENVICPKSRTYLPDASEDSPWWYGSAHGDREPLDPPVCHGFWFAVAAYNEDSLDSDARNYDDKKIEFVIGIGDGANRVLYSVLFVPAKDPILRSAYAERVADVEEADWSTIRTLPVSAGALKSINSQPSSSEGSPVTNRLAEVSAELQAQASALNLKTQDYDYVEFRLIGGRLAIRLGDSTTAYMVTESRIDENDELIDSISYAAMSHRRYNYVAISGQPLCFRSDATYRSAEIPIGFVSDRWGGAYVDHLGGEPATGWAVEITQTADQMTGPASGYTLDFQGPSLDLSDATSGTYFSAVRKYPFLWQGLQVGYTVTAIRAVTITWDKHEVQYQRPGVGLNPEEIRVAHTLNLDALTIQSAGTLVFNDNAMQILPSGYFGRWADWMAGSGQVAIDLGLTRTTPSGSMPWYSQVFQGYGHTRGEIVMQGAESKFMMSLADRMQQLDHPAFALPWLDGYNVFYAMAYLAQLRHVSVSNMAFRQYIGSQPFGTGSNQGSDEGTAYYLPIGNNGQQLTRFSGVSLMQVMQRIAYSIGYMLYFDAYGQLQFHRFRMPKGVKRNFFETDWESARQPNGGLEGCQELRVWKNMEQVRTTSIVIGIDAFAPKYEPIVFKYTDYAAIDDVRAFNHLGYDAPAVWIDSQFANWWFAGEAALAMYRFLRLPGYGVTFTTWLQPDIYPMDIIRVISDRAGTGYTRFMVTDVSHTVTKDRGRTSIGARYLPPDM